MLVLELIILGFTYVVKVILTQISHLECRSENRMAFFGQFGLIGSLGGQIQKYTNTQIHKYTNTALAKSADKYNICYIFEEKK